MKHKVILDTDPGIDDAMAIFFALAHPEIDLLGLTTVFGNVSVAQASINALTLLELAEAQLPVALGESWPMARDPVPFADFVHGIDGLGEQFLPPPHGQVINQSSAEFMIEQIMSQPGEINVVAVGPLSNLARALELEPRIAQHVKQVVLMGGSIEHRGNVSPVAEANIFADPHAADVVMQAAWPLTIVGLDVTYKVLLEPSLFEAIRQHNPRIGAMLQRAAEFYTDFYSQEHGVNGCYGHDVSALAYVVQPDLFTVIEGPVCVATEGIAAGQTIMKRVKGDAYFVKDWNTRPEHKACMQVNTKALIDLFYQTLTNDYWR
ncbi:nucleoside hydrolase [Thiolinea disciformis]|uniref:nucleoside hydrolase n=1 Tax=Thiolinea disciformis TaxID=125614 RepID=UPI00036D28FA|nr:nucleoside hydrolase [Thiolinea disciformis]